MANKDVYIVIAGVGEFYYSTKIKATSRINAEHRILDLGICGNHEYGVGGCQAYNEDDIKTEYFRNTLLNSNFISFDELKSVIEARNEIIKKKDEAENRIRENEAKIRRLQAEIDEAKNFLGEQL